MDKILDINVKAALALVQVRRWLGMHTYVHPTVGQV